MWSHDGRSVYFQDFLEAGKPIYRMAIPEGHLEQIATINNLRPILASDYRLLSLAPGDLPLVRQWLETPEVARWWGEADEQYALVIGDLDHPDMDQFIVAIGEHRFLDVTQRQLDADAIGTAQRIYGFLGLEMDNSTRTAMVEWSAANRPGARGQHHYSAEEYGLTKSGIRSAFKDYMERFDVAQEEPG